MRIVLEKEAEPKVSRIVISEPGEFRLDKSTMCGELEKTEVSICTNVVLWLTIIGVAILLDWRDKNGEIPHQSIRHL